MKKLLALVLAGAMALSMVACSSTPASSDAPADGSMKVLLVATALGDKSFNDSADAGLKKAAEDFGIEYNVIEYGNDNSKVEPTLQEAAESGYDIITCNDLGFGMASSWLNEHAAEYPDTLFVLYDVPTETVTADNVLLMAYTANEADFLAGALAAMKSESGVIGFVGGQETPVIWDFLVGYIEGAKYVNPDIKIVVSYAGGYTDPAKGKELGNAAIDLGADVLHGVAGSSGNGTLEAAKDAGKWGIGVDSDQYAVFKDQQPELANSIITSSLKEVGKSLYTVVEEKLNGTFKIEGERRWFTMDGEYVGLAENENYIANTTEEERAAINDIKAKMAAGEIKVDTAYGMETSVLNDLVASVAP